MEATPSTPTPARAPESVPESASESASASGSLRVSAAKAGQKVDDLTFSTLKQTVKLTAEFGPFAQEGLIVAHAIYRVLSNNVQSQQNLDKIKGVLIDMESTCQFTQDESFTLAYKNDPKMQAHKAFQQWIMDMREYLTLKENPPMSPVYTGAFSPSISSGKDFNELCDIFFKSSVTLDSIVISWNKILGREAVSAETEPVELAESEPAELEPAE